MSPTAWTFSLLLPLVSAQIGEPALELAPNATCVSCHAAPSGGVPMAVDSHRGSLMALASVDPFFRAAWEIARGDDAEVAELCARCHFPGAVTAGRLPLGYEVERPSDLDGIACDLCHRFTPPVDEAGAPVFDGLMGNAGFTVGPLEPKLGPLGSSSSIGHSSAVGPLAGRSETCGQCHDVTDTLRTRQPAAGHPGGGPVPLERTFREWTQSAFAAPGPDQRTCQSCHMLPRTGPASINGTPVRTLSDHRIVGSTTRAPRMIALMPMVLGAAAPDVTRGITAETEATSAAALELLRSAATMTPLATDEGVVLRVENHAGHKLPTGYSEGRRMWLELARVEDDGSCASLGGGWDAARCELTEPAPLRTWEAVLGEQGEKSFHFALVDTLLFDNRIPPRGFQPDDDTAPVGVEYPRLSAGTIDEHLAHYDDVVIPAEALLSAPRGAVFEARLLFQSTTAELLRFLVDGAEQEGPALAALFLAAGPYGPEVMTEVRFRIGDAGEPILVEGAPVCLTPLLGPPEPCLGLPVPDDEGTLDGGPSSGGPPDASATDDDGGPGDMPPSIACRCLSLEPRGTAGGALLAPVLVLLGSAAFRPRPRRCPRRVAIEAEGA